MSISNRHANYDQIAHTFDKRYERNEYAGVARNLREFIGSEHDLRILEVGCGTGHWLEVVQGTGNRSIGLDYSSGMLAKAQQRVSGAMLIRGDAQHLPLRSRSFDRMFCINALHHFPDKPAFLAEARRMLGPGGKLLSVGLDPHHGLDKWHVYDYFPESLAIDKERYPATEMLRGWMADAGFENCQTQEVEHWTIRLPAREMMAQGRLEKAATSQLSVLSDTEYERGLQRIHDDLERLEGKGQTLFLTVDLRLYGTIGSA